jgi:hypothetical protein
MGSAFLGILLRRVAPGEPGRGTKTGRRGFRPAVSALEERRLLATFTVTNIGNSGAGSLRQAIVDANTTPGANTINFSSFFNQRREIPVLTPLPALTSAGGTTIQGPASHLLTISGLLQRSIFLVGAGASRTTPRTIPAEDFMWAGEQPPRPTAPSLRMSALTAPASVKHWDRLP